MLSSPQRPSFKARLTSIIPSVVFLPLVLVSALSLVMRILLLFPSLSTAPPAPMALISLDSSRSRLSTTTARSSSTSPSSRSVVKFLFLSASSSSTSLRKGTCPSTKLLLVATSVSSSSTGSCGTVMTRPYLTSISRRSSLVRRSLSLQRKSRSSALLLETRESRSRP